MTSIEEARAFFAHWREIMTPEERAASDALLASEAAALQERDAERKKVAEAVAEIEPLVAASEAEYESEATADDPDDGKVSYPEDQCSITFGMIRRARKAITAVSRQKVDGGARG